MSVCANAIFHRIDPSTSNVDRWDAVVYWWDCLLAGKFPYSCFTRFNGFPSPFPFLQVICFSFYLIGELGWVIIASVALFVLIINYTFLSEKSTLIGIILIVSSLPLWWEICVRSTLFVNGFLISSMIAFILKFSEKQKKHAIVTGVFAGLILSTRMVVVIPLVAVVSFVYLSKLKLKDLVYFGISMLITFLATFLPFILFWTIEDLLVFNPISHHDRHMPHVFTISVLFLSFVLGIASKDKGVLFLSSGICLFILATIFVGIEVFDKGWQTAFHKNVADISYFILAFPSLIYSFLYQFNYKNNA
jgi:hypothetical protein